MTDYDSSVPNQISHKDLNSLLVSARQENNLPLDDSKEAFNSQGQLTSLLQAWTKLSQEVVEAIKRRNASTMKDLTPHQAMSLGALEVHIAMSLRAKLDLDKDF